MSKRKITTRRDADRVPQEYPNSDAARARAREFVATPIAPLPSPPTRTNSPPGVMTSAEALAKHAQLEASTKKSLDAFAENHRAIVESMANSGKVTP